MIHPVILRTQADVSINSFREPRGHVRDSKLDRFPQACEETDPSFQHFDAASLPVIEDGGVRARVIAGSAFGVKSPVGMLSEWLYAEIVLAPGASVPLDPDHEERAIYVVEGDVDIAGELFEGPRPLVFRPGDRITVRAPRRARLMLLGGAALEGPRHIWWNFVSSRRARIEQAKDDWKTNGCRAATAETPLARRHAPASLRDRSGCLRGTGRRKQYVQCPAP